MKNVDHATTMPAIVKKAMTADTGFSGDIAANARNGSSMSSLFPDNSPKTLR